MLLQMCSHQGDRLTNLATVMSLYSRGTFGKDSFQWTKCVVKYLLDVYSSCAISLVTFLVEVSSWYCFLMSDFFFVMLFPVWSGLEVS